VSADEVALTKLRPIRWIVCLLFTTRCLFAAVAGAPAPAEIAAETRRVMAADHVPGAAVGILLDGSIYMAQGLGVRSIRSSAPVNTDTAFGIASLTKAFTATVIAMLVDEGKLQWDAPVRSFLPAFQLCKPIPSDQVTLRDLASHRTGVPRYDTLWRFKHESRADLVSSLQYLPPNKPFREAFQYSNLMYVAAGFVAGERAGSTWEHLIETRLFAPLGTSHSTTSLELMRRNANFAAPHIFKNGRLQEVSPTTFQPFGMGPNGAINSSVSDMLRFLALHLDEGVSHGNRLVSIAQMHELHTPVIAVPATEVDPAGAYALGWFVQKWNGHTVLLHPGGIGGYSSFMLLVPDRRLAVVVLDNRDSFLPWVVGKWVAQRMLGLDPGDLLGKYQAAETRKLQAVKTANRRIEAEKPAAPSRTALPLAAYAGTYTQPAYGRVDVLPSRGGLIVRFNAAEIQLRPYRGNTFEYLESYPAFQYEDPPLRLAEFRVARGTGAALLLPQEPAAAPLVFSRSFSGTLGHKK
jgi:CubicO group peptidase (beta-lactamase class C family)